MFQDGLLLTQGARIIEMAARQRLPTIYSTEEMVLIPSGGREPSFGAARQNVVLARKLAQIGIASFRFDFAGLGDEIVQALGH